MPLKRFLVVAGLEAGIATALLVMAVSRLANPVPVGNESLIILRLCEGMFVVDVPVNEVDGVPGVTLAGMHVDVLISGKPPHWIRTLGIRTNTLLRNIEVLSAGPEFTEDAIGRLIVEGDLVAVQVVHLKLTPEQAELLRIVSHEASIHLVLHKHNPFDRGVPKTPGFTVPLPGDIPLRPSGTFPPASPEDFTRCGPPPT